MVYLHSPAHDNVVDFLKPLQRPLSERKRNQHVSLLKVKIGHCDFNSFSSGYKRYPFFFLMENLRYFWISLLKPTQEKNAALAVGRHSVAVGHKPVCHVTEQKSQVSQTNSGFRRKNSSVAVTDNFLALFPNDMATILCGLIPAITTMRPHRIHERVPVK